MFMLPANCFAHTGRVLRVLVLKGTAVLLDSTGVFIILIDMSPQARIYFNKQAVCVRLSPQLVVGAR